jgi:tRNA nucleotidyltransferase (CCA-adding enzyme)
LEPAITLPAAAARRDYTINALMYDPRRGEVLDFFGGVADLQQRTLRHTSEAFSQDPLRVLRGMQFAGRYNLTAAPETIALCRAIKAACRELAVERVREEWFKWAQQSTVPSAGLKFLAATEWVEHYPELLALIGTPQDPGWHPEGDVFVHTCHCCDALVTLPEWPAADPESRVVLMLAVLAHDFGKPQTTQQALKDGQLRIVSPAHEGLSGALTETFLERINAPLAVRQRVLPLVRQHMAHFQAHSDRSVRRLARNLAPETIANLLVVMTADASGCPPLPRGLPPKAEALRERAAALAVQASAPKPILLGRHLIELGLPPGPHFGKILHAAFEAQLEGVFDDLPGAICWAKAHARAAIRL